MSFAGVACIDSASQQKPFCLPLPGQRLQGMVAITNHIYPTVIPHEISNLRLDAQSMERLGRFQMRTATTIGTETTSKIYQKEILRLAFSVRTYLPVFSIMLTMFVLVALIPNAFRPDCNLNPRPLFINDP
jgi:hypothetical protein